VALGGGMAVHFPEIVKKAEAEVKKRAFSLPARDFKLVEAELGNFSGAVGAFLFAKERL